MYTQSAKLENRKKEAFFLFQIPQNLMMGEGGGLKLSDPPPHILKELFKDLIFEEIIIMKYISYIFSQRMNLLN